MNRRQFRRENALASGKARTWSPVKAKKIEDEKNSGRREKDLNPKQGIKADKKVKT